MCIVVNDDDVAKSVHVACIYYTLQIGIDDVIPFVVVSPNQITRAYPGPLAS